MEVNTLAKIKNLMIEYKEKIMTISISIAAILISVIAAFIALFQLVVNQDKLRLDLYNKRFDIYSKIIDLYLKLPSNRPYYDLDDSEKKELDNYKSLQESFIKYYRESKFLFATESNVQDQIKNILDKINFILFYINRQPKGVIDSISDHDIELSDKAIINRTSLEKDLLNLEASIEPYLIFNNYKPIKIIPKSCKLKTKK